MLGLQWDTFEAPARVFLRIRAARNANYSYAEMLAAFLASLGVTRDHFFRAACQFITTVIGGDEDESCSEMVFTRNRPSAVTS